MASEKIETIKKHFHREWLLILVNEIDENSTTPISGELIAHSPHRDEIYKMLTKKNFKRKKILVEFSEDSFPEGYAAAF
ncbi:MAG: hypothetical protein V1872_02175 [bacterium]